MKLLQNFPMLMHIFFKKTFMTLARFPQKI